MGYAFCFGSCWCCGRSFSFNPVKVPSIRVEGTREPICRACVEGANISRKEAGIEEFPIPDDAYEPVNEEALS